MAICFSGNSNTIWFRVSELLSEYKDMYDLVRALILRKPMDDIHYIGEETRRRKNAFLTI